MHRYVRFIQESAFDTPVAKVSGAYPAGTAIYPHMVGDNAWSKMTTPTYWKLVNGSGWSGEIARGTEQTAVGATLNTVLTASQAAFLLGWACGRIGPPTGTVTTPWLTTEPRRDLASCRAEFGFTRFDGSWDVTAAGGCKVQSLQLTATEKAPMVMAKLVVIGGPIHPDPYADPAEAAIAAEPPEDLEDSLPLDVMLFQHLRGNVSVGGPRTNFERVQITITNKLTAYFDETRYANALRVSGRTATVSGRLRLKASTDDRASWEKPGAGQTMALAFDDGTTNVGFDFLARNFFDAVKEDFPIEREVYYDGTIANLLNPNGSDFTYSVGPSA
jgi:hypothetical protein